MRSLNTSSISSGNWIARLLALLPYPDPAGIGLDVPMPALSGALSYRGGEPGVVEASALLPVNELMIRGPTA
jgi:hypothetical protein